MKTDSFIFTKDRLMPLFNGLTDLGYDKNLHFTAPLVKNLDLFQANLSGGGVAVTDFISAADYNRTVRPLVSRMKPAGQREIPDYDPLLKTLYQSGIVQPEGLDQLEEIFSMIEGQNILEGGDVYPIALDTNLLRDRFFSVYLRNRFPHRNLDFILCETVRHELKNRKDKLKKQVFRNMDPLPYDLLDGCFMNQNCLEDRMRNIGFLEYNRMRGTTACRELDARSVRSGAENDQIILETYSNFVDVGRKVVFISRDHEVVRMMRGEDNVLPILLEQTRIEQTEFNASWRGFFNLLYLAGVLFGKLHLVVGGVEVGAICGVWKGKDLEAWENDSVRLDLFRPVNNEPGEVMEYDFLVRIVRRSLSALEALEP
jgi:hypothetical protein